MHIYFANSHDTRQLRLDINLRIIGEKAAVEHIIRTIYGELLDIAGLTFTNCQAALHYVAWQASLHGGHTILYIHHGHIGICALTEEYCNAGSTGIRRARRHIHHALHSVDGFLQRHNDALLHGFGVCSRIAAHDAHRGRSYLGKLFKRQTRQSDASHYHNQD